MRLVHTVSGKLSTNERICVLLASDARVRYIMFEPQTNVVERKKIVYVKMIRRVEHAVQLSGTIGTVDA